MKLSIILPTYNEKDNVIPLIQSLQENLSNYEKEIIIIDDNSPDGTSELVKKYTQINPEIKLIVRTNERGLATAILKGINESHGDVVVFMDTDFSHDPKVIPKLLAHLHDADLVFASRYVQGGKMKTDRKIQYPLSKLLNKVIKIILGIPILDSTNGFFVARKKSFKGLNPKKIFDSYGDYCFKLIYYLNQKKIKMKEIPFTYEKRKSGASKTRLLNVGSNYLIQAIKLRFSD